MKPTKETLDRLMIAIQMVMNGDSAPHPHYQAGNRRKTREVSPIKARVLEGVNWGQRGLPLEGYRSQQQILSSLLCARKETNGSAKGVGRIIRTGERVFKRRTSSPGQG